MTECPTAILDLWDDSRGWQTNRTARSISLSFQVVGLRWVFIAAYGLSVVAAIWDYSQLRYIGFSVPWLLSSQSAGSVVVACRPYSWWASVVLPHRLSNCGPLGVFARWHV